MSELVNPQAVARFLMGLVGKGASQETKTLTPAISQAFKARPNPEYFLRPVPRDAPFSANPTIPYVHRFDIHAGNGNRVGWLDTRYGDYPGSVWVDGVGGIGLNGGGAHSGALGVNAINDLRWQLKDFYRKAYGEDFNLVGGLRPQGKKYWPLAIGGASLLGNEAAQLSQEPTQQ